MENVNAVKIEIEFTPDKENGSLRINLDHKEFVDLLIVFTAALHRDERLRVLVKQSINFLVSDEFRGIIQKGGL